MDTFQGWLAAPLTWFIAFVCFAASPRDSNPGWGIGVACVWVFCLLFCVFCLVMGNCYVSVIACLATGLDAVQRLEQKKVIVIVIVIVIVKVIVRARARVRVRVKVKVRVRVRV